MIYSAKLNLMLLDRLLAISYFELELLFLSVLPVLKIG